ncbi:hypothetical protein Q5424_25535 [Conexibacter sp. JD483]|uniref:hypothetical protein n=1 Tax=unclassified Conexibacter TaxID=2627773 RepID=UPI002728399A|nr:MULTISPECIES: hypothetical protein [unclassified Conexibacter]MDO8189414.1 hypothetical protein [Conexibacter sp. CPCC 205706]MDO8202023.1 hypothetical protein [Conexibacter sp. CPCC 205762]MDR9372486.1 hypothetical protein [Conexibacter sp. JD483]
MKLKKFYADSVRLESRERDLGLTWLAGDGSSHRVAWVEDTEEIYAVAHVTRKGRGPEVELLGTIPAAQLDEALAGWQQRCGRAGSFEWLLERVAAAVGSAPQPARPPRRRRARKAIADVLVAGRGGARPSGRISFGL